MAIGVSMILSNFFYHPPSPQTYFDIFFYDYYDPLDSIFYGPLDSFSAFFYDPPVPTPSPPTELYHPFVCGTKVTGRGCDIADRLDRVTTHNFKNDT